MLGRPVGKIHMHFAGYHGVNITFIVRSWYLEALNTSPSPTTRARVSTHELLPILAGDLIQPPSDRPVPGRPTFEVSSPTCTFD